MVLENNEPHQVYVQVNALDPWVCGSDPTGDKSSRPNTSKSKSKREISIHYIFDQLPSTRRQHWLHRQNSHNLLASPYSFNCLNKKFIDRHTSSRFPNKTDTWNVGWTDTPSSFLACNNVPKLPSWVTITCYGTHLDYHYMVDSK